jgi:hypothetical protein
MKKASYFMPLRALIFIFALLLVQPPATADDECDFDQNERERNYLLLEKKYRGSKYIKDEYKLVIPRGTDEVILSISQRDQRSSRRS